MKKALITGVTGQDGSYLSEFLIGRGYEVHGVKRRTSLITTARIDHLYQDPHEGKPRLVLHYGDLTDSGNLIRLVHEIRPRSWPDLKEAFASISANRMGSRESFSMWASCAPWSGSLECGCAMVSSKR